MAEKYGNLKALSNEQLIDRYNEQAYYTGPSAEFYLEEIRHRELCRLLEARRDIPHRTDRVDQCLELIELLSEWLRRMLEASPSIPADMERDATQIRTAAKEFVDTIRGISGPRHMELSVPTAPNE